MHSPLRRGFHLGLEPFVQRMVQEDVREAGQITPAHGVPSVAWLQETVLNGSRLQPFIDHPSDDAVRDSLVKERSAG